jgi:hypothetical protein
MRSFIIFVFTKYYKGDQNKEDEMDEAKDVRSAQHIFVGITEGRCVPLKCRYTLPDYTALQPRRQPSSYLPP